MAFWTIPLPGFMRKRGGVPMTVAGYTLSSGGSSVTINKPSGAAVGDLLVAFFIGASSATLAGWNTALSEATSAQVNIQTRTVDGSEGASFVFSTSAGAKKVVMVLLKGGSGALDVVGTPAHGTTLSPSASSITPTRTGVLLAFFGTLASGKSVLAPPSGMTEVVTDGATGGNAVSQSLHKLEGNAPGATGSKSVTFDPSGAAATGAVLVQFY